MYIKCLSVKKINCPIVIYKISKIAISENFEPLIKHGSLWINFTILTFINEKYKYFKMYLDQIYFIWHEKK